MRKTTVRIVAALLFPAALHAHGGAQPPQEAAAEARPERNISIREVPIWGGRTMKVIGVERTTFDSVTL